MDCNVIGFQGIGQYKITEDGSGFVGTELEPIIQSDDPNFRPVSAKIGPDGAIYILDWQNPIIGHLPTPPARPEPRPHARPHLSHHL